MGVVVPGQTLERHLLSERYRPLAHVVWARHADAAVLLDAERGVYYTLNEVASRAWELLVAGEPLIEILRCLADEFQVEAETLEADITSLLERLCESGLIHRIVP